MSDMHVKEWVTGIVVESPYAALRELLDPDEFAELRILDETDLLICDLADHHLLDDKDYRYQMIRIEYARTTDGFVCRAVANW